MKTSLTGCRKGSLRMLAVLLLSASCLMMWSAAAMAFSDAEAQQALTAAVEYATVEYWLEESCIKELPISTAARIQYLIISLAGTGCGTEPRQVSMLQVW